MGFLAIFPGLRAIRFYKVFVGRMLAANQKQAHRIIKTFLLMLCAKTIQFSFYRQYMATKAKLAVPCTKTVNVWSSAAPSIWQGGGAQPKVWGRSPQPSTNYCGFHIKKLILARILSKKGKQ